MLLVRGLLFIIIVAGCIACQNQAAGTVSPADLQPVAEIDLSTRPYDGENLGEFTLEEAAVVTIAYTLPNVNTTSFDLRLNDSEGESLVILHSENHRTDENGGGTWEQSLTQGEYRLVLTADQSPGVLTVYWKYCK
jgi:hypothetical protein